MPPPNNNYTLRADFDTNLNLVSKTAIFSTEIDPTTQLGIDRELIMVGLEGSNVVPIYSEDATGKRIPPRKQPQ